MPRCFNIFSLSYESIVKLLHKEIQRDTRLLGFHVSGEKILAWSINKIFVSVKSLLVV